MADFLEEKRKEIQARLKELKPAVEEYNLLLAADEALGGLGNGAAKPAATAAAAAAPARRARRSSGGGTAPSAAAPRAAGRGRRRPCSWSPSGRGSPSPRWPRRWASSRTTSTA